MMNNLTLRQRAMLKAIRKDPNASMLDYMRMTGIPNLPNAWYNVHALERKGLQIGRGVTWAGLIKRLKQDGRNRKIEGGMNHGKACLPHNNKSNLNERINAVVSKARDVQLGGNIKTARLVVEWGGGDCDHGKWISHQGA